MKDNIIQAKTLKFSVAIIGFSSIIGKDLPSQILYKQLLRSGT